MLQSKREIPCFYLNVVVDATELVAFREKLNKSVSFNDLIIKALAVGMKQWPIMTGRLEGDSVVLADSIGIGLAVAVKDGLITPVVKDVDKGLDCVIVNPAFVFGAGDINFNASGYQISEHMDLFFLHMTEVS